MVMAQPRGVIEERYIRRNTAEPFYLSVSKGLVAGHSYVHKFGANFDVDSITTPETIWTAGGVYPWSSLTTAQTLYIISTSASDTGSITIQGLDADYNAIEETLAVTGTTAVTTANEFLRVYRMVYDGNVGDITARVSSGIGTVVAQIDATYSQTLMAVYTVPAGHNAYLLCGDATINRNEDASITFFQRPEGGAFRIAHMAEVYQNSYRYDFPVPVKLPAKTDLDVRISQVETNNTRCTANFDLLLVKESDTGY